MELNHKSWSFCLTIALFRITRAASYTELPGSCGSSDRTDSSERTESSRSGFVSTRAAGNPLPRNGFNSSQTGITLTPMGYTGSSSSLGGPDHPLSTTLSTEEVKSAISSCKPKISFESNLPQITLALTPFDMNLLVPQKVHLKSMITSSLLTFICLLEVSLVASAFSSFRSISTVSPGLVNLYKAQVLLSIGIKGNFVAFPLFWDQAKLRKPMQCSPKISRVA